MGLQRLNPTAPAATYSVKTPQKNRIKYKNRLNSRATSNDDANEDEDDGG